MEDEDQDSLIHIGIVGYGKLGQFLTQQIVTNGEKQGIRLAFVWNRSNDNPAFEQLQRLKQNNSKIFAKDFKILKNLNELNGFESKLDLIVEVCHPKIVQNYGTFLLDYADLLIGSPTALADSECFENLQQKLATPIVLNQLFVARGALWGADDIQSLAQSELLEKVEITMNFHPHALRLVDPTMKSINDQLIKDELRSEKRAMVLYHGPVRKLCDLAPNNVNTMASAALIGIGFDRTIGKLVSNARLADYHRVEIEIEGKPRQLESGKSVCFKVSTRRDSPTGGSVDVTSSQTFVSFWNSVLKCVANRRTSNSRHNRRYSSPIVNVC